MQDTEAHPEETLVTIAMPNTIMHADMMRVWLENEDIPVFIANKNTRLIGSEGTGLARLEIQVPASLAECAREILANFLEENPQEPYGESHASEETPYKHDLMRRMLLKAKPLCLILFVLFIILGLAAALVDGLSEILRSH